MGKKKRETPAERLRALRDASGLSQADLAALSGIPKKTLQGLEQGLRVPGLELAIKLAIALNANAHDMADTQWLEEVARSISLGIPERKPGGRPRKE